MNLEQEIMRVEQDLTDQLAQEELLLTESYILKLMSSCKLSEKN